MSELQEEIIEQPNIQPEAANDTAAKQQETVDIEVVDAEQETQTQTEQKKTFDPKTDKVEFNTPEQQEKFNYMYKQTKMSDARNQMLTDMLAQATKRLEEVESRFKQTDSAEAERILFDKIKSARDAGDDMAEFAATKEMAEFIADKKLSEKSAPKPLQQPVLTEDSPEAQYVGDFMSEADETGQLIRPWMHNDHPDQVIALQALETIKSKYIGDPFAIPKTLKDLDTYMRAKTAKPQANNTPQLRVPNPMQGGNLTNQKQKPTIKMTRQEIEIARKLGVDPLRYAAKRDEIAGKK